METISMERALSILEHSSLRNYFMELHLFLRKKNPRLTQAAFSKYLGCSSTTWNNFIAGRRNLSSTKLLSIAKRIKWNRDEVSHAMSLRALSIQNSDSSELSIAVNRVAQSHRKIATRIKTNIDESKFNLDLLTLTLLQCLKIPEFAKNPTAIAKRIGISESVTQSSLLQLISFGLVSKKTDGSYFRTDKEVLITTERRSQRLRDYHRKMLEFTKSRIKAATTERRYLGTETFAFDPLHLPEAKRIVNRCLDDLAALASRCENPSTVYHAGLQLFEVFEETV